MRFDDADTVALIGVVTGSMRKFLWASRLKTD
jgi:hypothetical protein